MWLAVAWLQGRLMILDVGCNSKMKGMKRIHRTIMLRISISTRRSRSYSLVTLVPWCPLSLSAEASLKKRTYTTLLLVMQGSSGIFTEPRFTVQVYDFLIHHAAETGRHGIQANLLASRGGGAGALDHAKCVSARCHLAAGAAASGLVGHGHIYIKHINI